MSKLNAKQLPSLPAGEHGDGGGLYFVVAPETLARSWMFRWTDRNTGKRPEFAFADYPAKGIGEAREDAARLRNEAKRGRDPRLLFRAAGDLDWSLERLIDDALPQWSLGRPARFADDWTRLKRDAAKLVKLPVATITHAQVLAFIAPIW